MLITFGNSCNSQNEEVFEINLEDYTMQIEVKSNFVTSIKHGFDSKVYRAISASQETLMDIEVGFSISNLFYSKEDFENEQVGKESMIIPENRIRLTYSTNENTLRNISGKVFYPTDSRFLNCLNFEVSEKEFQQLIIILQNIKIKKQ